jgi:hypothetical protein
MNIWQTLKIIPTRKDKKDVDKGFDYSWTLNKKTCLKLIWENVIMLPS